MGLSLVTVYLLFGEVVDEFMYQGLPFIKTLVRHTTDMGEKLFQITKSPSAKTNIYQTSKPVETL